MKKDATMTRDTPKSGWLGRLWHLTLETSQAAVAVHYKAPWQQG